MVYWLYNMGHALVHTVPTYVHVLHTGGDCTQWRLVEQCLGDAHGISELNKITEAKPNLHNTHFHVKDLNFATPWDNLIAKEGEFIPVQDIWESNKKIDYSILRTHCDKVEEWKGELQLAVQNEYA